MFEINLVPDVKAEMLRTQKKRNFVFVICGVVSAIAIGLVLVLISVKAGFDLRINNQDRTLQLMSGKLEEFDSLDEILTIQKQLSDLEAIKNNKKNLSRVFTVLGTLLATNADDSITVSSLSVNLKESTISFDGQANAGTSTDGIDYRVLEEFTKKVAVMNYDYGDYVDAQGNVIPAVCVSDTDNLGTPYVDANGNYYAYWTKGVSGCDPSVEEEDVDENEVAVALATSTSSTEQIYRTPQFDDWYNDRDSNGNRLMNESGEIHGVAHFESQCANYQGITNTNGNLVWTTTYSDACMLAPDGVNVTNSSNGRETGGSLVLRFSAQIEFAEEVFDFNNKHMLAIAPKGRTNMTDSFIQIGEMFDEKAIDVESNGSTK